MSDMKSLRERMAGSAAGSIGVLLALAAAAPASAQETPEASRVVQGLEEVIVTAERREEEAQDVPMAISTLSSDMLERQQVRSIAQLDQVVPNIVMNPNTGTSSASKIFLRGVGEDESFFTADTPVGIYVDDVYVARQTGAMFDLFEIERLEVLRGPQGTLYGRNTSAGAVKLVSRKPVLGEYAGQAELTVGSFERLDARASFNVPLGEKAALQAAGLVRTRDGYTRNAFNGRWVNDQDVKGLRASLFFEPSESFSGLIVADGIRERSTPGFAVPLVLTAPPRDPLREPVPATGDFYVTNSDLDNPLNDLDQYGISVTLQMEAADNLTLKSITSYRTLENLLYLDADGSVLAPPPSVPARFHLYQDQEQYQVGQEVQALGTLAGERFNYVAGVFIFRENNDQDTRSVIGLPAFINVPISLSGRFDLTPIARESLTTDSWAVYASGTYEMTDRLALTLGARYTNENKDYSNHVILPNGTQQVLCINRNVVPAAQVAAAPCTPAQLGAGFTNFANQSAFDETWTEWTPRAVLDFRLTDAALVYASAAKGFKGGTTSGRDTAFLRNLNRIVGSPETNWSYELGLKADWLDRRLRTNVAAFHNEYDGLQFGVATPDGGFGRINAGDAQIEGLELEVTAVPVEGLELNAALGLLDSEYRKWTAALNTCAAQGLSTSAQYLDLPLKQAPEWSYRLAGNYSYDMGARGVLSLGADFSAKDDHFNNLCASPGIRVKDYEILNAQLRWANESGRLHVTLSGSNLTDSEVFNGGFDFARSLGFAAGYLYPPRMWALSVRYGF